MCSRGGVDRCVPLAPVAAPQGMSAITDFEITYGTALAATKFHRVVDATGAAASIKSGVSFPPGPRALPLLACRRAGWLSRDHSYSPTAVARPRVRAVHAPCPWRFVGVGGGARLLLPLFVRGRLDGRIWAGCCLVPAPLTGWQPCALLRCVCVCVCV